LDFYSRERQRELTLLAGFDSQLSEEYLHPAAAMRPTAPAHPPMKPKEVDVREISGDLVSIVELRVAKEDLGRVIGKQGQTAYSLLVILNAVATRTHSKVQLAIIE